MGNASARAQPLISQLDSTSQYRNFLLEYSLESGNVVFVDLLSDGKFTKSIACKADGVDLVMKIYRKTDADEDLSVASQSLDHFANVLLIESSSPSVLMPRYPNLLPYMEVQQSTKSNIVFLTRPYIFSNLFDRYHTRPFLSTVEKKWLAYQLLRAIEQLHACGLCHGNLTSDNVLVTSWNWLVLSDFAPYKPTFLPEDDPSEYYYYYGNYNSSAVGSGSLPASSQSPHESSGTTSTSATSSNSRRSSCNLAPERFYSSTELTILQQDLESSSLSPGSLMFNSDDDLAEVEPDKANEATTTTSEEKYHTSPMFDKARVGKVESMDIFSLGCVIAEIFLNGKSLFDLPSLLRYRSAANAEHEHEQLQEELKKIGDPLMEELILHMIQRDPRKRLSAAEYRLKCCPMTEPLKPTTTTSPRSSREEPPGAQESVQGIFPSYFDFLFTLMSKSCGRHVEARHPDDRVQLICHFYPEIVRHLVKHASDPEGVAYFQSQTTKDWKVGTRGQRRRCKSAIKSNLDLTCRTSTVPMNDTPLDGSSASTSVSKSRTTEESLDELQHRVNDFQRSKPFENPRDDDDSEFENPTLGDPMTSLVESILPPLPKLKLDTDEPSLSGQTNHNGILIIVRYLCTCLRHVQQSRSRQIALELLTRFASLTEDDEVRLNHIIPYMVECLTDPRSTVRALAIRSMTLVLETVTSFPISDSLLMTQYILPAMTKLPHDPEELVRISFAACIARLATSSRRLLDLSFAMKPSSSSSSLTSKSSINVSMSHSGGLGGFDQALVRLQHIISRFVVMILAQERSSLVKRALLLDITRLCVFFGRDHTLDVVLPQLISVLNSREDTTDLRMAFFQSIPGVCAFLGHVSLEQFVDPCINQALMDVEELVVARALACVSILSQLGLFQHLALIEKAKTVAPLLYHPRDWIRKEVLTLFYVIAQEIGPVNVHAFLVPIVRPYCCTRLMMFIHREADSGVQPSDSHDDGFSPLLLLLMGQLLTRGSLHRILKPAMSRECFDAALIASESSTLSHNSSSSPMEESFVQISASASASMTATTVVHDEPEMKDMFQVLGVDGKSISEDLYPSSRRTIIDDHDDGSTRSSPDQDDPSPEDQEKLKIMQKYIRIASMSMQMKLQLATSQYSAQYAKPQHTSSSSLNPTSSSSSSPAKLHRSLLHVLRIPHSKFVSLHAKPIHSNELTMEYLIRLYGLQGIAMATAASHSGPYHHNSSNPDSTSTALSSPQLKASAAVVMDPAFTEVIKLYTRIKALGIPPLPPDMGALRTDSGMLFSMYSLPQALHGGRGPAVFSSEKPTISAAVIKPTSNMNGPVTNASTSSSTTSPPTSSSSSSTAASPSTTTISPNLYDDNPSTYSHSKQLPMEIKYKNWKPKENVLMAECVEHSGAVNRLGVAQDFSFFVSGSTDATVKIWSTKGLVNKVAPASIYTYHSGHNMPSSKVNHENHASSSLGINDLVVCANSHSLAVATNAGQVELLKVDTAHKGLMCLASTSLNETSTTVDPVLKICHVSTSTASLLVYVTRTGSCVGWDIRSRSRVWTHALDPAFGYITSICHSTTTVPTLNHNSSSTNASSGNTGDWICFGSSRGYLQLFDLRFQLVVQIWRHRAQAPIYAMHACPKVPSLERLYSDSHVVLASGDNETGIYDLASGKCRALFRALGSRVSELEARQYADLEPVSLNNASSSTTLELMESLRRVKTLGGSASAVPAVRAMVVPTTVFRGVTSSLLTAGDDRHIRFWDLNAPKKSFTISGVFPGESRSFYDTSSSPANSETKGLPLIYMCQDHSRSSSSGLLSHTPALERRGPVAPVPNHKDCILDLKLIDVRMPMILSSGRDGVIKIWR